MRIGSLFTGTGSMDMAIDGEVAWVCDNMPAAEKLLAYHYPEIPNLGNIKLVEWESVPPVDIITAGFPCQPVSLAGRGLAEKDERWLWPEVVRAVRVLRPQYILLENVTGLVGRGLRGILGNLAEEWYDAKWACVRASHAGAPHRRERIFILATDAKCRELQLGGIARILGGQKAAKPGQGDQRERTGNPAGDRSAAFGFSIQKPFGSEIRTDAADTDGQRREGQARRQGTQPGSPVPGGDATPDPECEGRERETFGLDGEPFGEPPEVDFGPYSTAIRRWELIMGRPAPVPVVPIQRKSRNHSVPRKNHLNPEFASWMMGLPEGWITDVPGLNYHDQLRLSGNAVVPQQCALALEILKET